MDSSMMMNWLPLVGVFIAFAGLTLAMRRSSRADWDRMDKKLDAIRAEMKGEMASLSDRLDKRLDEKTEAQSLQLDKLSAQLDRLSAELQSLRLDEQSLRLDKKIEAQSAEFRQQLNEKIEALRRLSFASSRCC